LYLILSQGPMWQRGVKSGTKVTICSKQNRFSVYTVSLFILFFLILHALTKPLSLWPLSKTIRAASPKYPNLIIWDVDVGGWWCDDRLAIRTTFVPVLFSGSSGLLGATRYVRFRDGVRRCFANAFPPCSCCVYCSSSLRMVVIERPFRIYCCVLSFCGSRCCCFFSILSLFVRGRGSWICYWWFAHDLCLLILNLVFPYLRCVLYQFCSSMCVCWMFMDSTCARCCSKGLGA